MGASESTAKSNGATEEEEGQQGPSGGPSGASIAAGLVVAGVAAWGISSMLPGRRGFKMNTDGACRPNQGSVGGYIEDGSVMRGPSGYGGILLDDGGKWFRGFRGFIGVTDCLTAEFQGILKGLQLLDKLGVVDSILESDSKPAVDWISEERSYRGGRSEVIDEDLINECKRLKKKNRITVSFCSRNDNKCADKLASMAINDKREPYYEEIMYLPDEIKDMIV